jgi:hypothetical protein
MFRPKLPRVPEDLFVDTDDDVDYFVEVPLAECTETDPPRGARKRLRRATGPHQPFRSRAPARAGASSFWALAAA